MRVLLLNQVFYPDVAATAQHAHDLARHLVDSGHEVTAIASRSIYGESGASLPARETVDGIEIRRVGRSLFGKSTIAARLVDFLLFYVLAVVECIRVRRPEVVVCFTTPPFITLVGWLMRRVRGTRWVYWVMDLYPDVPVALEVMRPRAPLTRVLESIHRFCLRRADAVVVLGRCMLDRVRAKDVDRGQLHRIGVWSDEQEVKPLARSENPYRAEWLLGDRFVVMYSGNFGLAHDVRTMCEAARRLAGDDRIRFVFVGGGKRKSEVEAFVGRHGLANCVLAPYQPRERLHASLSCADVHLVSIREGLEGLIVPCKLFGIMAAERPAIFIGDESSELARVLTEHACGFAIREGDVDGLVERILALVADADARRSMGERARAALSEAYARRRACEQWEALLRAVVSGHPERLPSAAPAPSAAPEPPGGPRVNAHPAVSDPSEAEAAPTPDERTEPAPVPRPVPAPAGEHDAPDAPPPRAAETARPERSDAG